MPTQSLSLSSFGQTMLDYAVWKPVPIAKGLFTTMTHFVGWRKSVAYSVAQLAVTLGGGYLQFQLQGELYGAFGKMDDHWARLEDSDPSIAEANWGLMQDTLYTVPLMVFKTVAVDLVVNIAQNYIAQQMEYHMTKAFYSTVFRNQVGYGLDSAAQGKKNNAADHLSEDTKILLRGAVQDIASNLEQGTGLVTGAMSMAQRGLLSLGALLGYSRWVRLGPALVPDLLAYSIGYSFITYLVTNQIGKPLAYFQERLFAFNVRFNDMTTRAMDSIKWITLSNVEKSTEEALKEKLDEGKTLKLGAMVFSSLSSSWQTMHGFANQCVRYGWIGWKIYIRDTTIEGAAQIFRHMNNVQEMISWAETNAKNIQSFMQGQHRLEETTQNIKMEQGRIPLTIHGISDSDAIIVKGNAALKVFGKDLSSSDSDLTFARGTRTLVIGDNGSGKSSFLAFLRGIISGAIQLDGTILYPRDHNNQKIIPLMLTQTAYVPAGSLIDVAFSGVKKQFTREEEILFERILVEMKLDAPGQQKYAPTKLIERLYEVQQNWQSILSGGQLQKLRLAAAILQNPEFLLIDESFSALDPEAKEICIKLLDEYLPQTGIVVIDHHADLASAFYKQHIYFHEGKILPPGVKPNRASAAAAEGITHAMEH